MTNRRASQYGSKIPALHTIREQLAYCRAGISALLGDLALSGDSIREPAKYMRRTIADTNPAIFVKYVTE